MLGTSLSHSPFPSAAARAALRPRPFTATPTTRHPLLPSSNSSSRNPPRPTPSPDDDAKLSAFCAAVAEFSRGCSASPLPLPGSSPARSRPSAYNTLMKSFSRSGHTDEVVRLFAELRRSHPTPSALCYNTLINSLVVANRHGHAREVFDEMIASGVALTTSSYTIHIKLLSFYPSLIDLAYKAMSTMVSSGCQPDAITYSTLVAGLCRAGRVDEALGVLDHMIDDELLPTVQAFTCVVHGYCSEGRIDVAKRLLGTMESVGRPPDVVTYTVLIEALSQAGEFREVDRILMESEEKGWKPNEVTFNVYMNGLCKAGRIDEAFQLLEVLQTNALCPTVVTLGILFDCLCRDSKVWEANCLLEKSGELEWDVDVYFYNTLMSRFCEMGASVCVLKLLTMMLKRGIDPDTCTFTIVIRSLCKDGKLDQAKCIINGRGLVADVVAFNTLLHEFYMAERFNEVRLLYLNMNVNPNKFTYCIMIDTLCREGNYLDAIDCFNKSLTIGFFPDLVIRLNNWLVKGGKLREILNVVEEILSRGLIMNVAIFTSLVRAFCREGHCKSNDLYRLDLVFEKMLGLR